MATFRMRPLEVKAFRCVAIVSVQTLEGVQAVHPGDWIITGIKGEHYPCRDDIFRAIYAPVDEEAEKALARNMFEE